MCEHRKVVLSLRVRAAALEERLRLNIQVFNQGGGMQNASTSCLCRSSMPASLLLLVLLVPSPPLCSIIPHQVRALPPYRTRAGIRVPRACPPQVASPGSTANRGRGSDKKAQFFWAPGDAQKVSHHRYNHRHRDPRRGLNPRPAGATGALPGCRRC